MSLTGEWHLDKKITPSQKKFLKLMGRNAFERYVIDDADEVFCLFHFKKPIPEKKLNVHIMEKNVEISLNLSFFTLIKKIFKDVDYNKVKYRHVLPADNARKFHKNDEKRFGDCHSITSWDEKEQKITIRWYLQTGLLTVSHFVNSDDRLQVDMLMETSNHEKEQVTKYYNRMSFSQENQSLLDNHKYKEYLV